MSWLSYMYITVCMCVCVSLCVRVCERKRKKVVTQDSKKGNHHWKYGNMSLLWLANFWWAMRHTQCEGIILPFSSLPPSTSKQLTPTFWHVGLSKKLLKHYPQNFHLDCFLCFKPLLFYTLYALIYINNIYIYIYIYIYI